MKLDIVINVDFGEKICKITTWEYSISFFEKIDDGNRRIMITGVKFQYYYSMIISTLIFLGNDCSFRFLNMYVPKQLKSLIFKETRTENHILMPKKLRSFCVDAGLYYWECNIAHTHSKYLKQIQTWSVKVICNKLPKYLHSANTLITAPNNGILPKYLRICIVSIGSNGSLLIPKNLVKLKCIDMIKINILLPHRLRKMSIFLHEPKPKPKPDPNTNTAKCQDVKIYQTLEHLDTLIIRGYKHGHIENLPCNLKYLCVDLTLSTHSVINELYSMPNNLTYIEIVNDFYDKFKPMYGDFKKQSNKPNINEPYISMYTKS